MTRYKGYDIIFDDDGLGYYAQDFKIPSQPTSKLYEDWIDIKNAIDLGTITFQ